MYKVRKRDGRLTEFDLSRISVAVTKAFDATKTPQNPDIINLLTLQVTADFAPKVKGGEISVEDIQDSVEAVCSVRAMHLWQRHIFCTAKTVKNCAKSALPCWITKNLWTII